MKKLNLLLFFLLISPAAFSAPLPVQDAFRLHVSVHDANTLKVSWHIKSGYFLYQERIHLAEKPDSNFHLGPIKFPPPLEITDRRGRAMTVYTDTFTLYPPILGEHAGEGMLELHYQGCAEDGFCYPPQNQQIKLTINTQLALTHATLEAEAPLPPPSLPNDTQSTLFSSSWPFTLAGFFGLGLLLSFTPCVLPMIPVLSGLIIGQHQLTTRKTFLMSLSYVLSMAATYAVVGALLASLGHNLQMMMQSPVILTIFSLIFVLLALSMFGFYALRLPPFWQQKLEKLTQGQSGKGYLGAAIMGCLSTLVISPCITAPMIGILGYIAQSGNIVFGSFALFILGLGMGTPLLLIGASAGKILPKTGAWMEHIKIGFGFLLLAVALYLIERILPASISMGLWASLFIAAGVIIGQLHTFSRQPLLRLALGLSLLTYGVLIAVGLTQGNTSPWKPLHSPSITHGHTVNKLAEVHTLLAEAQSKQQPVLLDFYADWCTSCKFFESTTLTLPEVQASLHGFVIIKVDVTANTHDTQALLHHFNVIAPPTFIFLTPEGEELLSNARLVGDISTETFLAHLTRVREIMNM